MNIPEKEAINMGKKSTKLHADGSPYPQNTQPWGNMKKKSKLKA